MTDAPVDFAAGRGRKGAAFRAGNAVEMRAKEIGKQHRAVMLEVQGSEPTADANHRNMGTGCGESAFLLKTVNYGCWDGASSKDGAGSFPVADRSRGSTLCSGPPRGGAEPRRPPD